MKTDIRAGHALRVASCHYGFSKLQFRGPARPTDGRYIAFLGGSETYAKFINQPYPDLVETAIGDVCVNLGCQAAGADVFLQDRAVQSLCHDADATVIQVPGAVNASNAFYRVHPRRNDRFIAPSAHLTALYPEVDFTEIAFTGHLIARLKSTCKARFAHLRVHLQAVWMKRMTQLIAQSNGPTVLLWLASRAPEGAERSMQDPVMVNRAMLETLRPSVVDIVEVMDERGDTLDMGFAPENAAQAREMFGLRAHARAAKALRAPLLQVLR